MASRLLTVIKQFYQSENRFEAIIHMTNQAEMVTSTSTPGSKLMLVWIWGQWMLQVYRCSSTHDLLDNLAGSVQVDQALVNLELITIPCLGTLTTRLNYIISKRFPRMGLQMTYSLTGGDLQDLGGEADRSLDTELLVLGAVDEIAGDWGQSLSIQSPR